MAHLVVGDKNCDYNLIIQIMNKSSTFHEVVNQRKKLAIELNIRQSVQQIINKNYKVFDEGAESIMETYLTNWRCMASKKATLGKLLTALDECNLRDLSDAIREADFFKEATKLAEDKKIASSHGKSNPDVLPGQQQNRTNGQSQMNMNMEIESPSTNFSSQVPSTSSQITNFRDDVPANESLKLGVPETMDADGVRSWLSWLFGIKSENGSITSNQSACRTFVSANNITVSLKKRPNGLNKLGQGNYCLPGTENGYALILNMISYPKHTHPYRDGAQYDSLKLTVLLTQLGYKVTKYDDPSLYYTKEFVKAIVQEFRDRVRQARPKSVVVFIGGHGAHGAIETSDGKFVNLFNSIVYQFDSKSCPEMKEFSKIFIVNACRDPLLPDSHSNEMLNTVVCYSALPMNVSYRQPGLGSLYIRSLVKIIAEKAWNMDFISMIEKVSEDVRRNSEASSTAAAEKLQQPMHEPYVFGQLYFNVFEDETLAHGADEDVNSLNP